MIEECNLANGGQHLWLPVESKSIEDTQCYSCPMCELKIYWSKVTQKWISNVVYTEQSDMWPEQKK